MRAKLDPVDRPVKEGLPKKKRLCRFHPFSDAELLALYRKTWGPDWQPETLTRFRDRGDAASAPWV
jgi:hypothetical protein